jgi:plastocyanin
MKNLKLFSNSMLILIIFSATSFSQNLFVVELANFMFTPSTLTIEVGDTVKWTNVSGTHNVLADNGSFTSGSPAPSP